MADRGGYLRSILLRRDEVSSFDDYPFSIPAIRSLSELSFHPRVTFLVGENGTGKSTLIEAIAVLMGLNAEGGSRNFRFGTRASESVLHEFLRPRREVRHPRDAFFLRAESYFNVGTQIEELDKGGGGPPLVDAFGGVSIHEQSHGESFIRLVEHRFRGHGLYILDEPEAALSPRRQLTFLSHLDRLARTEQSQFIIATHSPILMAYPHASILSLDAGLSEVAYEETEHYQVTRDFMASPERFFKHLLD
jgi:predicted ATPase